MNIFGIIGWKNSGKTGLMERLVSEITKRGFKVSTIKHAHHSFDIDHEGRDSFRHRQAGASEVLLSSNSRWALMHELRAELEPNFSDLISKMKPVDLILVEGFKKEKHSKLECHRIENNEKLIYKSDRSVCLIASDIQLDDVSSPNIDLEDPVGIANFILTNQGLI
jgi:molybdopterin-guanine dinucleotide biosynthesis protein MobB